MEKSSGNKQDIWLNHIKKAQQQKLTLAAYAKQHKLSDKSIYRWKKVLTQRGILPGEESSSPFVQVVSAVETMAGQNRLEIVMANGHRLTLQSIDSSTLISIINSLRNK